MGCHFFHGLRVPPDLAATGSRSRPERARIAVQLLSPSIMPSLRRALVAGAARCLGERELAHR